MALLGSSVDPRLFVQDYSGFARAAEIQGQGMANLGAAIGQGIKDFGEARQERKKLDAGIKANRKSIESALKLGESLGIDVSSLNPILEQMDDPNTTPMEAAALGQAGAQRITDTLNLGIGMQDRAAKLEQARAENIYKQGMLGAAQTRAAASLLGAQQAAQPKYELKTFSPTNPETGETYDIDLPYNPQTGRPIDPKVGKEIMDIQSWFEGNEAYAPEPAMPTPTSQVGGGMSDLIASAAGMPAFTSKTRDQLPPSSVKNRYLSLDFNAASNPNARGIEVIVPNNATPAEFAAAEKYNKGVQEYFAKYGVKVPIRGVKTTAQNKRGSGQIIHLEPAFGADKEAMAVMKNYPEEYAQVVSNAFSGLPVTVIAPHKQNDPGAVVNGLSERGFATDVLIPAFARLSQQRSAQANPAAIDNALSMGGDMTQQSMGTPEQQAMLSQQIEQGQQLGLATAQNIQQGAMPTEASLTNQQPQLPQQAPRTFTPRPGAVLRKSQTQYRKATPEEVATYGTQGQVDVVSGEFKPIRPQSGMVIEQTPEGGFRVVQGPGVGGKQALAQEEAKKQSFERTNAITSSSASIINPINETLSSNPLIAKTQESISTFFPASESGRIAKNLETIKNATSKEEISNIRRSSITGSAGGNITEKEWPRFENRMGVLEVGMNPQDLSVNLQKTALNQFEAAHGTPDEVIGYLQNGKLDAIAKQEGRGRTGQDIFNEYYENYKNTRLALKIPSTGIPGDLNQWTSYNFALDSNYSKKDKDGATIDTQLQDLQERINQLKAERGVR